MYFIVDADLHSLRLTEQFTIPPEHLKMTTLKGKCYRVQLDEPTSINELPYEPMHSRLTLHYRMYSDTLLDMYIFSKEGIQSFDRESYAEAIEDVLRLTDEYSKQMLRHPIFFNCLIKQATYHEEYMWPNSDNDDSNSSSSSNEEDYHITINHDD